MVLGNLTNLNSTFDVSAIKKTSIVHTLANHHTAEPLVNSSELVRNSGSPSAPSPLTAIETLLTTDVTTIINKTIQWTVNTTSATKPFSPTKTFEWVDIMLIISFVLIFLIGIAGNALVCYFFKFSSNKLQGMAKLIYYLAVVDLFASVINPIMYLYWQVTFNRKWHFGNVGCKVLPMLAKCSITISLGIILLITIDRCIVISRPFHPRMKDKHMNFAVFVIVVYSVLCETPMMKYSEIHPKYTCLVPNLKVDGFFYPTIVIYISRDLVFLVAFLISVMIIYLQLYNKASVETLKEQKDLSKNENVMRMLVTLAAVFIFLVFPREILHIVYMMSWKFGNGIPHSDAIRNVNAFLKVLHMCNSICNVFIYAGLHARFRKRLRRFLLKIIGRQYKSKDIAFSDNEKSSSSNKAFSPLMNDHQMNVTVDTNRNGYYVTPT